MFSAFHHFEQRRRISSVGQEGVEPYPHPNFWYHLLDDVMYLGGFLLPVVIVPQIVRILRTGSAKDLSPISWGAITLASVFMFIYGIAHRQKPLIFVYFLSSVLHLIVLVEIFIYGRGWF